MFVFFINFSNRWEWFKNNSIPEWSSMLKTYSAVLFPLNFTGWSRVHIFLVIEWITLVFSCNFYDIYWLQDIFSMGGACSRKQEQNNEDSSHRRLSRRYSKSGSLKWSVYSFSCPSMDFRLQKGECPSLLDLCVQKICEVHFEQKLCLVQTLPFILI